MVYCACVSGFFTGGAAMAKEKVSKSLILLILAMVLFAVLAAVFYFLDKRFDNEVFFVLFVTMLTIFYHFAMRLAVGEVITLLYAKREFKPKN